MSARVLAMPLLAALSVALCGAAWLAVPHPLVGLALALLPLAAVLVLRDPFPVALGFVLFSFFRLHEAFPALSPLRLPQLLAIATLAAVAAHVATRRLVPWWSRELSLLMVFAALVTLGVPFAANRPVAIEYWNGTFVKMIAMVPVTVWLLSSDRRFGLAAHGMVLAGIAVSIVALRNQALGIGLVEGTRVTIGRDIGSMLGDPNDLALVLTFPVSFAGALLLSPGLRAASRLLGGVGLVLTLLAILATQSRGGILGFVAVMGVLALRHIRSKLLLGLAGGLALAVLAAVAGIADRASGGAQETGIDESAMGRLHAWQAAWAMALARPLTGVGIDNFYANYFVFTPHWDGKNHAVHSTWFGVLAESGFPGFVAFVALIVVTALAARRAMHALRTPGPGQAASGAVAWAAGAGLAGFCVSGTFLTQGFTWPLYILIAITVAVERIARTASQNATQGAPPACGEPSESAESVARTMQLQSSTRSRQED